MNVSVERLRVWLLVGAGLLVLVTAGFLGYAYHRAHRFLTDLPQKLGVDIRRETNGYTYSQSVQGKTVYTIHAAKAVERSDGKVTLHDVGIVLYGRNQDRADRIYGKEFEYDQASEVIRALGEVHIDLSAPEAADANKKMDYASGKDLEGDKAQEKKDERLVHVTTSGLVFLRKLGVAATDKDIEFASGGLTGHAVGADYNSDTGVLVLHSLVKVNGLQHERPVLLTASRAELDRTSERVSLTQAKYVVLGGAAVRQAAQGQHVVVHLRKDGTAERLEADGDVTLTDGVDVKVTAPRAEMMLNEQNQPRWAVMSGGVKYSADDPLRQAQGEASQGRVTFGNAGRPEHVAMTGAVHLRERVKLSEAAGAPSSERELNGSSAEFALTSDRAGRAHLQEAKVNGNARLQMANAVVQQGKTATTSSVLTGDVVTAQMVQLEGKDHVSEVQAEGHATLHRVDLKGVVQSSSADMLVAHFQPAAPDAHAGAKTGRQNNTGQAHGSDEISTALEQGHVVLTQQPPGKAGETVSPEQRATADRAAYDGERAITTLTGHVQVSDGMSVLWADRVITEQVSGDATADGSVKASYAEPGSTAEPLHVLASRAEMKHDSQVAIFYGVAGRPARMWQGASQVDAPLLQLDQRQRRLLAHGTGSGSPMAVHTVLVSRGATAKSSLSSASGDGSSSEGRTSVVQVQSRELTYSDEARRADFTGGFVVESADGRMRGEQIAIYLQAASAKGVTGVHEESHAAGADTNRTASRPAQGFMGGSVERMVASGGIEIEQPGRKATGSQVVYTADDGMFVLTGTPATLPKVIDDQHGTVTGTSLRFHGGDQSVVVSNGGKSGAEQQRVRTETRVKNRR